MLETTAATQARPESGRHVPEEDDLDFDWRPEPLQRAIDSDRTFRWPIVIAALFIGVAVALSFRLFILGPANSASARLDEYRAVAVALDSAAQGVLDSPTGAAEAAAVLDEAVVALQTALAPPLPGGPIGGQGPSAELSDAHDSLTVIADAAVALASKLEISTVYRQNAAAILTMPLLPDEAPEDLIDAAERTLGDYRVAAIAAVARFGDEPEMEIFRTQISEFVDNISPWSDLYLIALSRGETANVQSLLDDLRSQIALATAELDTKLAGVEGQITTEALALITSLQQSGLLVG